MKILVVEDESLIGMDLVMMLEDRGHVALGPHPRVQDALAALEQDPPDFALLDINLGGDQTSLPVAAALDEAAIPFAFLTGYNQARFAEVELVARATVLRKPLSEKDLDGLLADAQAGR